MKINSYDFDIYYKNGKRHSNANAMTGLVSLGVNNAREGEGVEQPQTQEKYFRHIQRRDEYCEAIMHIIENDQENRRDIGRKKRKKVEQEEEFVVRDGLLYHIWKEREKEERKFQLVVPTQLIPAILFLNHDHT